jgi:hypothetical protein
MKLARKFEPDKFNQSSCHSDMNLSLVVQWTEAFAVRSQSQPPSSGSSSTVRWYPNIATTLSAGLMASAT